MTREEEIKNAKKTFYERIYEEGCYYDPKDCFEEGAEWADEHPNLESLWHDASEEPQESMNILCLSKKGSINLVSNLNEWLYNWLKNESNLDKWAYVSDLLPKGGKK